MLKLLYKTLLISAMSCSLMTMNMLAFAETTNNSATAKMSDGITRDANGMLRQTTSHDFKGTESADNALHVITMLAVGVIGTKLLMYKKWTLDMSVVAAASVIYIGAEIVNIMNLGTQLKDMHLQVTRSSDGKLDQAQIDTLQKLKESYEKVKKSAELKKMLQMGAAAAFAGALGIAAYQRFTEEGMWASCEVGIAEAEVALATCIDAGTAAAAAAATPAGAVAIREGALCSICAGSVADLNAWAVAKEDADLPESSYLKAIATGPKFTAAEVSATAPCGGEIALGIKSSKVTPACHSYLAQFEIDESFSAFLEPPTGYAPNGMSGLDKMLFAKLLDIKAPKNMSVDSAIGSRNLLQKTLDIFIPRAEADMIAMLGLGAGALTAFLTAKTVMGKKIDTYMFTPGGRMTAWTVMAGAAYLGAQATEKEIKKVDSHIKDIEQILSDLNTLDKGVTLATITQQQIKLADFSKNQTKDLPLNPNASVKTDCIASTGSSNCTILTDQIKAMPGFTGLPDAFQTIATQSTLAGDGLSGKNAISGSTLAAANSLGGKLNAIGKLNDSLKTKLNDALTKAKKPKIDFDKKGNELWGQLKSQTASALGSMSPGAFLAGTGISPLSDASAAIAKTPSSSKKTSAGTVGAAAKSSAKDKGFDLDFKEAPAGAFGADRAAQQDEKFDIGTNDINTNSGDSIFKVISNRYIKSAYPKLFDEIPFK